MVAIPEGFADTGDIHHAKELAQTHLMVWIFKNRFGDSTANLPNALFHGTKLETDGRHKKLTVGDCWYAFIVGPPRGSSWLDAARYTYHIKQDRFARIEIPAKINGETVWAMQTNMCQDWRLSDPNQPLVQPATKTVYVDIAPAFRDGTYRVGQDIDPGIYHSVDTDALIDSCYWERLRGLSGSLGDIIENGLVDSPRYVEIKASDLAFMSDGCGTWTWTDPNASVQSAAAYTAGTPRFGDGTHRVGRDIDAGVYHSVDTDDWTGRCSWERLRGLSGSLDDIIESVDVNLPRYAEIKASDLAFTSRGCGMWTRIDSHASVPATAHTDRFGEGSYLVGQDIDPGVYHSADTDALTDICYWERLRGFSGSLDDVIENGLVDSPRYVEIKASDLAFMSDGCGMWTRID